MKKAFTIFLLAMAIVGMLSGLVFFRERLLGLISASPESANVVADQTLPTDRSTVAERGNTASLDPLSEPPPRNPRDLRQVPDVSGRTTATASQLLRLVDLELRQGVFLVADHHWRDDVQPGVVYLQSPPPTTPMWAGQTVACWTLAKAEPASRVVQIPDLRGVDRATAARKLKDIDLLVLPDDTTDTGNASDAGIVRDHYPKPGQQVIVGTSVLLRCEGTNQIIAVSNGD